MRLLVSVYCYFVAHVNVLRILFLYTSNNLYECQTLVIQKYSTRIVRTKYGPVRGIIIHGLQVEAFLGVPYATPPIGSLRFMPPMTPFSWKTTLLADTFSAVCPQKLPDISNRTEALLQIPRGRLIYLEKLLPLLSNQSEDCLYLNIYVPRSPVSSNNMELIPTLLYIHGESYEWNAGNPYDGSVLANYGNVIVVTINYRLGILGFLKTGTTNSSQGNYGIMDIVAGLHWLKENLVSFGGDPDKITVMGHSTGAALVNFIALSPVTKNLLQRVVLLSGSGLSPWALQREPFMVKRKVAEQTNCHGDLAEEDMAPCLRGKNLQELLSVRIDPPRFLPGFAPFVDGTFLSKHVIDSILVPDMLTFVRSNKKSQSLRLTSFPEQDLLFGLTSVESYSDFCAQDLEFGISEMKQDRVLRTFVRNCYYFHLNEIFSTLKNEYTDWERSVQNPLSIRDSTLDILSDGHTASYLLKIGHLHSIQGGRTFFFHFLHHLHESEFPQNTGSIKGDDIPFILGFPLIHNNQLLRTKNYSEQDSQLSKQMICYISNFVKTGDPNEFSRTKEREESDLPFWDPYDAVNQLYLELGSKTVTKSHYRGHKMSVWLNLIPQLHRAEYEDTGFQHHHFKEESPRFYDGMIRSLYQRPFMRHYTTVTSGTTATTEFSTSPVFLKTTENVINQTQSADCVGLPENTKTDNSRATSAPSAQSKNTTRITKNVSADSQNYQNYTIALIITISVGCFLLLLNILIFSSIYRQRENIIKYKKRKKRKTGADNSRKNISGECKFFESMQAGGYEDASTSRAISENVKLDEYVSSNTPPLNGKPSIYANIISTYTNTDDNDYNDGSDNENNFDVEDLNDPNLSIPEPPPPPKTLPPDKYMNASLKQHINQYSSPELIKNRSNNMEISV